MTSILLFVVFLQDNYLGKCCSLGNSWAKQKMLCERFASSLLDMPISDQSVCLEAVDICCRKTYQKEACAQGKAHAKSGASCLASGKTSSDLAEYRHDCCEGCKLGILTGSSGKGCSFKKFSLSVRRDLAFKDCCNEAITDTIQNISSTTTTASTSPTITDTINPMKESKELNNGIDETTDLTSSTILKSEDLCHLMGGMLCSEICISTPGSYYCQCQEGSMLEENGRSCKSKNILINEQTTIPMKNSSAKSTISIDVNSLVHTTPTSLNFVSKSPLNSTIPEISASLNPLEPFNISNVSTLLNLTSSMKNVKLSLNSSTAIVSLSSQKLLSNPEFRIKSMWLLPPAKTFKMFTSDVKTRTTRSLPTEDNELNQPCPPGYRFTPSTETCDDIDECSEESTSICPLGNDCINVNGSYQCIEAAQQSGNEEHCELGYRWNSTLGRCSDVDECSENFHKCLIDIENCKNLEGSYECEIKCKNGFIFNTNYGACLDINECIELTNVCLQLDTICVNTLGSFECRNLKDYQHNNERSHGRNNFDGGRMNDYEDFNEGGDIDECQLREQPCSPGEICRNTIGGYDCIPRGCPRGFFLVNEACQDVNECERGLHSCGTDERCQNTNGSFTCEQPRSTPRTASIEPLNLFCRKGYKVSNESGICVDIDECVVGPGCRDHEKCRNLQGSYDCSPLCGPGWYFQLQTKTCQDVDECLLGRHNCRQRTHYCRNTNGSFVCEVLTACASGYRRNQNGSCIDLDECLEGVHTCSRDSHRYCVNREGGYECITRLPSCSRGFEYSLLTHQCEDVDECRSGKASCESRLSERCVNLPGSYRCERPQPGLRMQKQKPACPTGYSYDVVQRKCSDIDECADGTHNCGKQKCYNSPGSFQCAKATFPVLRRKSFTTSKVGIGSTRDDNCSAGTRYVEIRDGCVDVNECEEVEDACSSNEECKNTIGSFHCTCILGFRRDDLTQACVDVNECQLENDCLASQRCDNTIGSYTCVRFLPCGTGYTLNAATEICEDDDECSLGTHDCGTSYHCRNTLGSYRCDKNRGRATTTQKPTYRRTIRPTFRSTILAYTTPRTTSTAITITTTTTTKTTPQVTSTNPPKTTAIVIPKSTNTTIPKSITANKSITISTTTTTTEDIPTVGTLSTITQTPKSTSSIRINCPQGFESGPLGQCIDINECYRNFKICGGQRCTNTIGSYRCEPRKVCSIGYAADPITEQCKDINECAQGLHKCGSEQTCENRQGGYICYCPSGYEVTGNHNCMDVDECERALPDRLCGDVGYCVNTPGSYRCECKTGFEVDSAGGGCRDIDECIAKPGVCQQECYNTWGSYKCDCGLGYRLRNDNHTCEDIDECSEFKGTRLCVGICDNTPGSYICRCPDGYKLTADSRTCQDTDECAIGNACKRHGEICQNIRGGFRCNKVICPSGYTNDPQRKNRCIPESPFCSAHDQACLQRPVHYSYNYISIVSMFPIPAATGELELFTMHGTYNLVGSSVIFSMAFIGARAPPLVQPATESCFALRKPFPAQAVLVMTRSLQGPQDIELEFSMEIYGPGGTFAGSAVAKIFIVVTQYEF